jgi:hypothetical protein
VPSCAWYLATVADDNTGAPDSAAAYWFTPFTAQAGLSLVLSGRYPDARYTSLEVTAPNGGLFSVDGVSSQITDYRIAPDPGSVNPWQRHAGWPGGRGRGRYTVSVRADVAAGQVNTLPLAPPGPVNGTSYLLYRVYLPAHGDVSRVPLPVLTATLDGVSQQIPPCPTLPAGTSRGSAQARGTTGGMTGVPAGTSRGSAQARGTTGGMTGVPAGTSRGSTRVRGTTGGMTSAKVVSGGEAWDSPAAGTEGTTGITVSGTTAASIMRGAYAARGARHAGNLLVSAEFRGGRASAASTLVPFARPSAGAGSGISPNADTGYLAAALVPPGGDNVLVIRGKAPAVPRGDHPAPWPVPGVDMQYWSMCDYVDAPMTPLVVNDLPGGRVDDGCRHDSQTALDRHGYYTYVVGTEAQRGAIERIPGATFLPFSTAQPTTFHILLLRNMVVSPRFAEAIQNAPQDGNPASAAQVMGPYYPAAAVCPLATLAASGPAACLTATP